METIMAIIAALVSGFALGKWHERCKANTPTATPKSGGGPGEENDQPGP